MSETVTVEQMLVANGKLDRITKLPLPIQVSYRLTKIANLLREEMRFFEMARDSLIQKYGVADGNGGYSIAPTSPKWGEYVTEMRALTAEEVAFPFTKIDVKDLPAITAEEVAALGFMLTGLPEEEGVDAAILARREQLAKRQGMSAVH